MSFLSHPIDSALAWIGNSSKKRIEHIYDTSVENISDLGIKGLSLCEMARLGLPVPDGFIILSDTSKEYMAINHANSDIDYFTEEKILPDNFEKDYLEGIKALEIKTSRKFGQIDDDSSSFPLLLSVRASSEVKSEGMLLDTVLNLGMNDHTYHQLSKATGNEYFAATIYYKYLIMFGSTILKIDHKLFDNIINSELKLNNLTNKNDLNIESLNKIIDQFKLLGGYPDDPYVQLRMSIEAMYCSWFSDRAKTFRSVNHISPNSVGMAVIIQSMVYGNMNAESCSGVGYSRHPGTGENVVYGEFLPDSEGLEYLHSSKIHSLQIMKRDHPKQYSELVNYLKVAESHYKDVQALEFTIESGNLYILEAKSAVRTPQASLMYAVNMVEEKLIGKQQAVLRVDARQMNFYLKSVIDPVDNISDKIIGVAMPASNGAVSGKAVFNVQQAIEYAKNGIPSILIKQFTTSDDMTGLLSCSGVLTMMGGITSHAAETMRFLGKCAVTDGSLCGMLIDEVAECVLINGQICISKDQEITLDGNQGRIINGKVLCVARGMDGHYLHFMDWVERYRRMRVLGNISNVIEAQEFLEQNIDGIGACYMENMLIGSTDRLNILRCLFLANMEDEQNIYLHKIRQILTHDFEKIFKFFLGKHVTVNLMAIDFKKIFSNIQTSDVDILCSLLIISSDNVYHRIDNFKNSNLFCDTSNACQLAIMNNELLTVQIESLLTASHNTNESMHDTFILNGLKHRPVHIAVSGAFSTHEISHLSTSIGVIAKNCIGHLPQTKVKYSLGVSLDNPRVCMAAKSIAESHHHITFMPFDTEELTKCLYGMSREDAARVVPIYQEKSVLYNDPFQTIDEKGIGYFLKTTTHNIRATKSHIRLGVSNKFDSSCSAHHCIDLQSIKYFESIGLDYLSCNIDHVTIVKVAAAQAAISNHVNSVMFENDTSLVF